MNGVLKMTFKRPKEQPKVDITVARLMPRMPLHIETPAPCCHAYGECGIHGSPNETLQSYREKCKRESPECNAKKTLIQPYING